MMNIEHTATETLSESAHLGDDLGRNLTNSDGSFSAVVMVVQSVMTPVICCMGIVGNILNIIVLTRQRIRRSVKTPDQAVHVGLIALAVSDMVVCLSTLPRAFIDDYDILFDERSLALYYQTYGTGLITTFGLVSTWLIVVTAGLRYAVICYPLLSRGMSSHKRVYCIIFFTCFFCILGNSPSFLLAQVKDYRIGNETYILIDLGPFNHETTPGLVFHWIRAFTSIFIPGLLLVFFNIRLIQALKESDRLREQYGSYFRGGRIGFWKTSRNRLNMTLVAVIVTFVCLVFPAELLDFFAHVTPIGDSWVNKEAVLSSRMVLNALQLSNFAFNFVLYCVLNAQFRKTLTDWCCHRVNAQLKKLIRNGNDVCEINIDAHARVAQVQQAHAQASNRKTAVIELNKLKISSR